MLVTLVDFAVAFPAMEVVMARQDAWMNSRGKMQFKEWVIKKEPEDFWMEKGDLEAGTNCSGCVRTYTRIVGKREKTLKSERELKLTPIAGRGNRVDLRCTVPCWGQTIWARLIAWYFTQRPAGLRLLLILSYLRVCAL